MTNETKDNWNEVYKLCNFYDRWPYNEDGTKHITLEEFIQMLNDKFLIKTKE